MLKEMLHMNFQKEQQGVMGRGAVFRLEPRQLDEGIQQQAGRPLKNRQLGDEHAGPIPAELDGAPLAEFPPEISSGKFPHGAEGAGPPARRLPSMPEFADGSTSDKSGGSGWRQKKAMEDVSVRIPARSEEHTSELQSRENLVCRLLLEKKK